MRPSSLVRFTLITAALALAACAHVAPPVQTADAGEVALAPATTRAAALLPIHLDEVLGVRSARRPDVRQAALTVAPAGSDRVELWRGRYEGRTYGQRGALAFVLRPGSLVTDARGLVAWRVVPAQSEQAALVRSRIAATSRDSDRIVLQLDEHYDPACNCTARATFRGVLRGDTLSGRFTMTGAATVVGEERGRWRVVRVTPENGRESSR